MKSPHVFLFCGLLVFSAAWSQGQDSPAISGYVTRAASGSDFDVNGIRVLCGEKTRGAIQSADGTRQSVITCHNDAPFIGEILDIYGVLNRDSELVGHDGQPLGKVISITASRIDNHPMEPRVISGSAVVNGASAQVAAGAAGSGLLIDADGYRIRIDGKTKIEWTQPLQSLADVKAGTWIKYKGKLDATGVVAAASAEIGPNAIGSAEEKLRQKEEFDPASVPADTKQNFLKDGLAGGCRGLIVAGCDAKKFPPFADVAMQARVEKIGSSLVPAYQRALADTDPAKIEFRFQLIDTKLFREALTLPNGIILIPHQVVERTQNDSQLAAVLADAIAKALERQQYRAEGKRRAGYAMLAGAFVPYAGLSIAAEGASVETKIFLEELEQSSRVSLELLHNAGFDIDQAPVAWWLLEPAKPQDLSKIEMPYRAAYLYQFMGTIWHNPAALSQSTNVTEGHNLKSIP